ncbi:MAG: sulfatase-like hydrolase/transferase [Acidobacteria bacterium]|nr:sulfatase-like hydrolase/transferase [Acidobacteriota bacterium]
MSHEISRRTFLAGAPGVAVAPRPVNVLFVLADSWRSTAFSGCGDPLVSTPNFSRFAEQGVRFTRMYATNPLCTPNRSCILTGRFSFQNRMIYNNIMLPPDERSFVETFSASGYATHYIGKWHMDGADKPGYVPRGWRRRGFQTFEGFNRGHYYPTGAQYFTDDGKLARPKVYEPVYQTDLAIDFMKRNRARPFFCFLSWGPPHGPYRVPKEWDRYDPAKLEWRANVPREVRDDPDVRANLAGYYGSCTALDHEFGRLMKALDEEGLAANTLVAFTSDHGDMHGSHAAFGKSKPEEESLHIPLYMRLPGRIRAKQAVHTLASSIDLAPTILSICARKPLPHASGRDLSAAVLGGPQPKVESVYAEGELRATLGRRKKADEDEGGGVTAGMEWRCVVTPTHKLAVRHDGKVAGLFDLEKDPLEMKNLAGERSHTALQKHLLERLERWGRETGDPFPNPAEAAQSSYA